VSVNPLAQRFGVSAATIRGDLRVLAQAGLVQRQVADGSKFGRICLHRICALSRIHVVVSDASMPLEMRAALSQQGIQVLIADSA